MIGFKNAPNVTEFKRGMEFTEEDQLWHVVIVYDIGAVCLRAGSLETRVYNKACFPDSTVNLDSIWEGKRYVRVVDGGVFTVVEPGSEYIVVVAQHGIGHSTFTRDYFLKNFTPIDPEPGQVTYDRKAVSAGSKKRDALFAHLEGLPAEDALYVVVTAKDADDYCTKEVHFVGPTERTRRLGALVREELKEQIAAATKGMPEPEPPVKVGDVVQVETARGCIYGQVTYVDRDSFTIPCQTKLAVHTFKFTEGPGDVTITKLVPEGETKP